MPRYSVDDKVYNIPEDKEQAFLKKFPNAKLKIDAPFKMHDGTEDPETHPEGNEVDVTVEADPNATSNTGSESEDISSDSQQTTTDPTQIATEFVPEIEVQADRVLSFDEFIIAAQDRPEEMVSNYSPEKVLRDKLNEFHKDSSFEFNRGIQFPGFGKDDIIITDKDGKETRIVLPTRKTDLQDVTFTQAYKEYYQALTGEEFDESDQQTIVDASQEMYDLYGKKNFHHDGTYADFMAEIKPIYQESKYVTQYDEKGRKKSRRVKGSTTISGIQRMDDGTFVDLRNPQVMTMVDGKPVTNYEPITQARVNEFYRKMFMYEESEKAKKVLGNSLISEKIESTSDVTTTILNNKGNTTEQTAEYQENLREEQEAELKEEGLTKEDVQDNIKTTVDLLNYVDDKNDIALQKTKEAYEQRVADGTFTGTFDEYKEIAYDQEKLNSDFSNYIEPAYAEFNAYYEQQYAELIKANEEAITNSIDQELEPELLDFQLKITNKSQKIVDKKAEEISNRLNKEVENLVKSGEFGPRPTNQKELEATRDKANEWFNENFKKEIDKVIEQVNSDQKVEFDEFQVKYNEKRNELWQLKQREVASDLNENMANAWNVKLKELQNEYMQQWNPGTTTIPDSVVASSFTRLSRDGFAQMTTENKNMALSIEWEAVERGLIETGFSADEVQIMKEEYFYKAYEKLAYDADGQRSSTEIINSAKKAVLQLDKIREENGSLDSEEQEAYDLALEIIDAPEKMSGVGLKNFFMGLADASLADYIPIVGDVVDLLDKRAIKKITDKPAEERSEGEKLMLKMYISNEQMKSKASSLSNAYASGFGLSGSIRMVGEFGLMYTPAGWASKGVKLGLNSINKLGLTYLAKYGDDVLKAYAKSSKGFNLTAKLERKFPILGSVKNPKLIIDPNGSTAKTLQFLAGTTTMTTIGTPRVIGNTYAGMTPEMAISYSEVGDTYVEVINEISEGESFNVAFKEYGKEWVQFASERFGAFLPGISKYIKGATGLDALDDIGARMVMGRFMKKFGIKPNDTVAFINKVQERGGWNGMIGEVIEEIIAQPPTNLIDGRSLTDGMDADFFEQTFISTAAIQGMFGTLKLGGRAKSFINDKISKPKYQVGKVTYDTAEEAYEAAKKMKENGELTADTKIVIKRDFEAYDQMSELLEGTDIEIETNNAQLEINDRTAANEIEAISMLDPDQVKTVEDNKKKLEEITNKWKNSELNRDSKEYQDDKALFQSLQEQNNEILDPVLAKINERQSAEDLKKGTSLIQRWKDKLKLDNINIVSVPREQARDLAIDGIIEDSLNQVSLDRINTEVQTFVNAETGKRMFVDSSTGVEISNKQLLDAGIDYNAIVQEAQNNVDDFKTTHGFTTPMRNGRQTIVINKESAINMGRGNVAAHEFMHVLLNKTFANNPETALAVGRALEGYLLNIDPKNVRNTDFRRRLEGYRASQGEIVAAEETLTLFSDALANGEIKFNETTFTKIGDIIRRAFSAIGVRVNFDSAEDVFNFVRDYNNTVAKGKNLSAGVRRTMAQGARVSGEIAYGSREYDRLLKELGYMQSAESRMSKEDGDLKSDFDQYTLNKDGTPKYNTQEEFKQSEDYYNAYTQIVDSTSLDGIIKRGMTEFGLKGAALDEFTRKVKEEIGLRYLGKINKKTGERGRGFDVVATNGSLFGWLTGVAGGQGKSIIFRAKGDVMNQYKKDKGGETVSLDKNIGDGATFGDMLIDEGNNMINTFEQENLSHTEAREQAVIPGVFASAFGLNMETISNAISESNVTSTGLAYVDAKKAVSDVQKVKNKKGKLVVPTKSSDVVPTGPLFNIMEIVAAKFGVPASRVLASQTLSNSLRINAQNAIKENWKDLRDLALPEGETVSGQSTLVANTGLGAFYNKGERISMKQSGSAVGKEAQTKRTDITKEQFWAEFGINPDGSFMSGTKFDNNIRELIKQAAAITANQGVRMNDIKSGTAETAAVALFGDGRSALAFSKEFRGLSPAKKSLFISEIPQISALVNPSLKDVADWKEVRDILVSVFKGEIPASTLGGIAKDIVKMAKYFKPVADSVLDEDGFKWGNYVANNFTEEADNIVKLLNIKLFNIKSRKQLKGSDLYDDIDLVSDARKIPGDIGKALLNTINPKTEVNYTLAEIARVMAILKPMYANAAQIGRGKFKVDENGKLYEVTPDQLMKDGEPRTEYSDQRYQVFDSAADFMKWGVLQVPGMTQDIYDAANTKLIPQNSKYAVEKGSYEDSLAEATEVREVINIALNVVGNNDVNLAMFMVSANSSMKSPIRRAANLKYIADSVKNMNPKQLGSLAEYEHMIPANYMAIKIIQEHKKGGIKDINEFYKDYTVAVIPKTMDNVLKAQGLQSLMNAGYQFGVDPSWFRYYNSLTIPFAELETIRDISTGELIGEPYTRIEIDKKIENAKKYTKARNNALSLKKSAEPQGMSTFDFDETLIIDGQNFVTATKGSQTVKMPSDKWPIDGPKLAAQGYDFDFSDFVNVRGGKEGPLLQKMKNQIKKYGPSNVFVLTARMQEAAEPIHKWLKSQGINIPIENITGLGRSEGEAKAQWFVQKYAEGYNDMYFVDDALSNVKAVKRAFDALDVKGKSVQARINFSKEFSDTFNQMLERTKGVGAQKAFSRVEARRRGKNKGKFTFFVPPSAEDFAGLLRYFAGTGAQGDADVKFFEEALIKPFARADRAMSQQKQAIRDDYKALQKEFPSVKKMLGKLTDGGKYTYDMAVRVYLFDKAGYDIPGISNLARINMINLVKQNQELRAYADALGKISRQEQGYLEPTENWDVENIAFDLQNATGRIGRKQFLAEFLENKDIIFSPENLNKIEAVYGSNFRSALEDVLYRMQTGQNRRIGATKFENAWNNWINNSVGAIMFFNARSAVLQTLSTVNFVNFEDNNVFAAGKAFANQKQYWSDFSFLFNSDFLRNRRAGLATNVNEAELANAVAGATNKAKAALGYLLKIGFTPTQIADSFAIASGGATFYRNRVNTYLKQGMSQAEAESQAFLDFQEIAEETQQSARPDKISQQQASNLGRIILAFANTPMQYNRLIKKAAGDLINGRGDWRSNVSRIAYYGAIQNFIFAAMQNALFALAFDDDEELTESQQAARDRAEDTKNSRILNSMFDSLARGSGIYGAALATLKNAIMKYMEEDAKGWRADYAQVVIEALNVSPPLGSKARKLYSAGRTRKFSRDVMSEMSMLDYDNPAWQAIGNVVEATTNIPMARAIRKIDNIREALNKNNSNMQRMMLFLGWSAWDLNVGTEVIKNEGKENEYVVTLDTKRMNQLKVEQELDAKKAKERKQQAEKKRQEKKEQEAKENERQIKENIEKQKEEGEDATCAAVSSKGDRCKRKPIKDGFCTVHEKVEQNEAGKKTQCKKVKSDGKRCKMQTNSKSGFCYYHD